MRFGVVGGRSNIASLLNVGLVCDFVVDVVDTIQRDKLEKCCEAMQELVEIEWLVLVTNYFHKD